MKTRGVFSLFHGRFFKALSRVELFELNPNKKKEAEKKERMR